MNKALENIQFENLWRKDPGKLRKEIIALWKQFNPVTEEAKADEYVGQVVVVIKKESQVIGISSATKTYIKQLRNYLYAIRLTIIPDYGTPGLTSALIVKTRDFLESIHKADGPEQILGIIAYVENNSSSAIRSEAIWPGSQMVYIGNSSKGHHIRVYYFKGATIL